jgi:hypothetical protein
MAKRKLATVPEPRSAKPLDHPQWLRLISRPTRV